MLLVEKKHGPVEVSRADDQCLGINFLFKGGGGNLLTKAKKEIEPFACLQWFVSSTACGCHGQGCEDLICKGSNA